MVYFGEGEGEGEGEGVVPSFHLPSPSPPNPYPLLCTVLYKLLVRKGGLRMYSEQQLLNMLNCYSQAWWL